MLALNCCSCSGTDFTSSLHLYICSGQGGSHGRREGESISSGGREKREKRKMGGERKEERKRERKKRRREGIYDGRNMESSEQKEGYISVTRKPWCSMLYYSFSTSQHTYKTAPRL